MEPEAHDHDPADAGRQAAPRPRFTGKYLSLTSYRPDGTGVATPVWFVERDGKVLVQTDAATYKVRRIRRNPAVTVAPCTASGRLRGPAVAADAEILPATDVAEVERLMTRKYRLDMLVIRPLRAVQAALHLGRPRTTTIALVITPR